MKHESVKRFSNTSRTNSNKVINFSMSWKLTWKKYKAKFCKWTWLVQKSIKNPFTLKIRTRQGQCICRAHDDPSSKDRKTKRRKGWSMTAFYWPTLSQHTLMMIIVQYTDYTHMGNVRTQRTCVRTRGLYSARKGRMIPKSEKDNITFVCICLCLHIHFLKLYHLFCDCERRDDFFCTTTTKQETTHHIIILNDKRVQDKRALSITLCAVRICFF